MKLYQIVSLSSLLLVSVVGVKSGSSTRQVPIAVPPSGSSNTYSQPIPSAYAQPAASTRHEVYAYSQPMAQASNQAEFYQPVEPAYGGTGAGYGYARHQQAQPMHQQPAYYEPIPQGSGHHPIKRGHGHGFGWHPHAGIENILFIGIPLIILLFLYPYILYATSHHHHPIVYAGGWKRSSDGKAPTIEEAKKKKTDELTEKIVSKLDKSS